MAWTRNSKPIQGLGWLVGNEGMTNYNDMAATTGLKV